MNSDLYRLARDGRLQLRFRRGGAEQRVQITPDESPCPAHVRRVAERTDDGWRPRGSSQPLRDVRVRIDS